jgi:hypothetical protein
MVQWQWLPVLGLLAACSSAHAPAGAIRSRASADVKVDDLKPTFNKFSLSGDYCPPDTYVTSVSPDGYAFEVGFSNAVTAAQGCVVTIDMDMPAGFQMANPTMVLHTYGQTASLARSYAYDGASDASSFNSDLADDNVFVDRPNVWSPSCDGSSHVRLLTTFSPTVQDGGLFQIDSFSGDTTYRFGADWRRCGDSAPLQAAPGAVGEYCGGPHNRPCADALACDYDSIGVGAGMEGACVDPTEQVPPAAKGSPCGGARHIACQDGLVCWTPNQASADKGWVGRCEPAVGGAGDICEEGVPAPTCGSGLTCSHPGDGGGDNTCVANH